MKTITPRNYAAKAANSLRAFVERHGAGNDLESDLPAIRSTIDMIEGATHFAVPDGGVTLENDLRGLEGHEARLPYPYITLEFRSQDYSAPEAKSRAVPSNLLLAYETTTDELAARYPYRTNPERFAKRPDGEAGIALLFLFGEDERMWMLNPYALFIPRTWESIAQRQQVGGWALKYLPFCVQPATVEYGLKDPSRGEPFFESLIEVLGPAGYALLTFCEALTCRNVSIGTLREAAPQQVNSRRERNGKLPLYEIKTLMIEVPTGEGIEVERKGTSGERSGPRAHLRRGHVRRLASGNIWINSMIVGAKNGGWIEKGYNVK
ncbi:hypothetical protein [Paraburkholderia sp. EG304]|uniref:hypothetical protein n=1 Tax=Paraburkholderia sp. EG304 TaxID=3237015 RepID=UPI003979F8E0